MKAKRKELQRVGENLWKMREKGEKKKKDSEWGNTKGEGTILREKMERIQEAWRQVRDREEEEKIKNKEREEDP